MSRLSTLTKTMAIPLLLTIAPGCTYFQSLNGIRMQLIEQLGGEREGKQDDGSIIKCAGSKKRSAKSQVRATVRAYFKSIHEGKQPHIETVEKGGITCGKASGKKEEPLRPLLTNI